MARMAPLQIGKHNKHVNESYGSDNNIMKFYITEYSSKHGLDGFQPRYGQHIGTGYKTNLRPQIYYSRKLDELDNPNMGKVVSNNYYSITDKDYRPYHGYCGKEPLPIDTFVKPNAMIKDNQRTIPSYHEANSIFVSDPTVMCQKSVSKLKTKDHIVEENNNHGPTMFSTEHKAHYQPKHSHVDITDKIIGQKQDSGFTLSKNVEPITFRPDEPYDRNYRDWFTMQPTGVSIMKTHYLPHLPSNGNDKFQDISVNAERDNGFTRYILPTASHTARKGEVFTKLSDVKDPALLKKVKQRSPVEYVNMKYPHRFPSLNQATYQGKQLHEPTLAKELNNLNVGDKEASGYVENNKSYTSPPHQKYSTHYGREYIDKSYPLNRDINDTCVRALQEDGFTKSEKLHTNVIKDVDSSKQLKHLDPYVNRSLKARDPFYAEKIYEHKKKQLVMDV